MLSFTLATIFLRINCEQTQKKKKKILIVQFLEKKNLLQHLYEQNLLMGRGELLVSSGRRGSLCASGTGEGPRWMEAIQSTHRAKSDKIDTRILK